MQPYPLPLAEAERPGLLPDRVRDADATEVGRERGAPQEHDVLRRELEAPRGRLCEVGHARGVLAEPRRLETGQRREGGEPRIDALGGEAGLGEGLAFERVL